MNSENTVKTLFEPKYVEPNNISKHSSPTINKIKPESISTNHAKEYANATSIHGIKYIAEDDRHPVERCNVNHSIQILLYL